MKGKQFTKHRADDQDTTKARCSCRWFARNSDQLSSTFPFLHAHKCCCVYGCLVHNRITVATVMRLYGAQPTWPGYYFVFCWGAINLSCNHKVVLFPFQCQFPEAELFCKKLSYRIRFEQLVEHEKTIACFSCGVDERSMVG